MALDRQSIEKKDFPVGRRGYDPEAVDAHLSTLADEIADLKRTARRRSDTLASSASEQVRAIVEAAESSAADIQRDAENEAREIREEANSEAQATREQATEQAREYVGKVSESTDTMLQRLDSMESELSALIDTLRTGGNRLTSDLRLLESNLADVGEASAPRHQFEPEEPAAEEATTDGWGAPVTTESAGEDYHDPDAPDTDADAGGDWRSAQDARRSMDRGRRTVRRFDDAEGARLIALNMALNGTPRDETARYLSENFHLADTDVLLDEVSTRPSRADPAGRRGLSSEARRDRVSAWCGQAARSGRVQRSESAAGQPNRLWLVAGGRAASRGGSAGVFPRAGWSAGGGGSAEVVALAVVDAEAGQHFDGFLVADELGDRALAHAAGDLHDCGDQDAVGLIHGAVADELAVDLEVVEGQVLEVVEGAEAGAEVVEGEVAAQLGQALGELRGRGDVGDRGGLGDLEDQA